MSNHDQDNQVTDQETVENVDDVDETKLDDDIDNINNTLDDLEAQKASFEVPEELALNTGVNSDLLTQMAEKLKTMPRNKILQMINSLARANQLPDHDFSNFGPGSVKSNTEKINKKIKELRAKRTKMGFKQDDSSRRSRAPQDSDQKKQLLDIIKDPVVEEPVVAKEESVEEEKKPTKLTKNQKRKLRVKANKAKLLSDSASHDSNIVASVSEETVSH